MIVRRVLGVARVVLATTAAVACASCASPTIPLPPPLQPTVTVGSDANHFKLSSPCGGAEGGAIIVIENTDTSIANDLRVGGSISSNCGSWDATVYAVRGDVLTITQSSGSDVSLPQSVQIPLQ